MASHGPRLDLEAWSIFLKQEQGEDYDYKILLNKFRAFYNEVKDFIDFHSECSVSQALRANRHGNAGGLDKNRLAHSSSNWNMSENRITDNGNQPFKRYPLQHQQSMPLTDQEKLSGLGEFPSHPRSLVQPTNSIDTPRLVQQQVKHFNSSYNISPSNFHHGNSNSNQGAFNRPEIRRRNNALNSQSLISKSSERLDVINNNNNASSNNNSVSALRSRFTEQYTPDRKLPMVQPDCKRYDEQNEDSIYDAVSPDDLAGDITNSSSFNMTSSVQNLSHNQTLQSQRSASKSMIGSSAPGGHLKEIPSIQRIHVSRQAMIPSSLEKDINNSHESSLVFDCKDNSSSSLSILASSREHDDSPHYANIDFFLKRSHSPSFDGLDEDITNDEGDESNEMSDASCEEQDQSNLLSQSTSSDQICNSRLFQNMSPRALVRQLSGPGNISPSSSMTPASSSDLLDERANRGIASLVDSNERAKLSSKTSTFIGLSLKDNPLVQAREESGITTQDIDSALACPPYMLHNATRDNPSRTTNDGNSDHTIKLGSNEQIDENALVEAQNSMRSFLSDLNLKADDDIFGDKAQRRIVKESFVVEFCSGRRKLRHLFLFNDVIVCAKYQASSKQKFTFDVKWYLTLNGVSTLESSDSGEQLKYDRETIDNQILAIRTNLMLLRGQMQHLKRSKHKQPSRVVKKLKKKRTELEAELVLLLPHLVLVVKHINGKKYTFFLSSNFDRSQWIESIRFLQSQLPAPKTANSSSPSSSELQAWIQTCRKNLNPSLGTFLLRSNCDDDLLHGDLRITLVSLSGISKAGNYYFCFEVDSYGHFSQKACSTILTITHLNFQINEDHIFPLDGAHTLRLLLYADPGAKMKPSVVAKATIELSRALFINKQVEKVIPLSSNCSLTARLSYSNSELLSMRVPHSKLCPTFGLDITQVCKKEKTTIPLIIQMCVNEVERRGMREVGIYRMSGTSTDIQRLKRAFETNPFAAEILLRDIDINSVTGFLKTYLREIPEGLFSNKLYPKFFSAFNIPQSETLERTKKMLEIFHMIPKTNQETIIYLVDHLVKVNYHEAHNKMSLTNLATVLGPNILKQPSDSSGLNSSDPFSAVVINSMSQAGILYFFLNRRYSNLPLTELDPKEMGS